MKDLIIKSAGASLLISLGVAVLLSVGNPLGPFLFAFGLLGVCVLKLNLFTGKCGFWLQEGIRLRELLLILAVNMVSGYLFGYVLSLGSPALGEAAVEKMSSWDFSLAFFIRSMFCGIIMYLCVAVYKRGSSLGIILGIPLFIFCGFQHCVANVIVLGAAHSIHASLLLCVLGNFAGSLLMWWLAGAERPVKESADSIVR